jgi:hypothetical protein
MPSTRTDLFLAAKRALRAHRGWSNEEVAEFIGCHRLLIDDCIVPARREVEQDEGPVRDT